MFAKVLTDFFHFYKSVPACLLGRSGDKLRQGILILGVLSLGDYKQTNVIRKDLTPLLVL